MKRVVITLLALLMTGPAFAKDKISISVGSYNLNNLPFPLTESLGHFKEQDLEVKTENFAAGGSKVLQALLAGSTDIAVGFYDHTIQMQAQGKEVVAIALLARNSGLVMAAGKDSAFDPAKPETIKGAKVGITAPGSSSDFFVRYFLDRHGLPGNTAALVGVGSGASAVAALEQKKVDLLVNYDPAATLIVDRGAGRIVIDARTDEGAREVYGGVYPTSTLYTTAEFIRKHPETVQKVVTATVKTLKWMQAHSAEEIFARIPSNYVVGEKDSYIKAIINSKTLFSSDGRFVLEDLKTAANVLRAFNEKVEKTPIDLDKTYTNRFVDHALTQVEN
ncbi:ABC transporter substrate-binding protein [Azospirillum sp.]|uniref:ABC transporter substrate-binding protein n=1 Tax=Azospirillum sp. TaxID=34012 RepID=UPI002D3B0FEB|nr:ABC transporter substrate-binding protein [Azospirillum sp.]HYD66554.1 ABC transporter substrate-binding protein [Azospirillum sp.]